MVKMKAQQDIQKLSINEYNDKVLEYLFEIKQTKRGQKHVHVNIEDLSWVQYISYEKFIDKIFIKFKKINSCFAH